MQIKKVMKKYDTNKTNFQEELEKGRFKPKGQKILKNSISPARAVSPETSGSSKIG